jgi:hypothetical protein
MKIRERGIGNVAFIFVLVLFVIAVLMWFMASDQVDTLRTQNVELQKQGAAQFSVIQKWKEAYGGLAKLLQYGPFITDDNPLSQDEILKQGRTWLTGIANEVAAASQTTIQGESYRITAEGGVQVSAGQGDIQNVQLYVNTLSEETVNVAALLAPMANGFRAAARHMKEAIERQGTEFKNYEQRVAQLTQQNSANEAKFGQDVQQKQANIDSLTTQVSSTQDTLNRATADLDAEKAKAAQDKDAFDKSLRQAEIRAGAAETGLRNERARIARALAEDPKDGEVIEVSGTLGTVFLNLGRKHHLSAGTVFKVWRPAKGNIREDIAVLRVIRVEETLSESRIIKELKANAPVTKGMNISNPFYDPRAKVPVHIWGNLRSYPTDVAKKRLAAAGAEVVPAFDDTVRVVILGEPPVEVAAAEDEAGAAAAEKAASMERERRLNEAIEKANAINAVVVTEDALRTFMDY